MLIKWAPDVKVLNQELYRSLSADYVYILLKSRKYPIDYNDKEIFANGEIMTASPTHVVGGHQRHILVVMYLYNSPCDQAGHFQPTHTSVQIPSNPST